ncbi:MAG: hypothetical protein RLZZ450_4554 [Pseudomonadota bacterium]
MRVAVPALLVASSLFGSVARAEQFVVTDVSYTHSKDTTDDSHYRVAPLPGSPTNWKSPVDYSTGSAHIRLEVKTKPTDTPTRFQICFEGANSYGCTAQSVDYTKTGTYEWTSKFSEFWYPESDPAKRIDWSKGVKQVALILKDTNNNKPQGDAKYVPTDLRVQVAIISSGASFAPPVDARDAGTGDAAQRPLPKDAGTTGLDDASTGAPQPPRDAATGTGNTGTRDAATPTTPPQGEGTSPGKDGGSAASEDDDAGTGSKPEKKDDTGCNMGSSSLPDGLALVGGLLLMALARRKRRVVRVALKR